MSIRLRVMAVGLAGAVAFLGMGFTGLLPWVFAGPVAASFVTGWILTEGYDALKRGPPIAQKPKLPKKQSRTVSLENSPIEEAVTIQARSSRQYQAKLRKEELLTVEAGAEDWIILEIISKGGYVERSKEGRNLTMEFESKRNGNWDVYVSNPTKDSQEVGITLTVEA